MQTPKDTISSFPETVENPASTTFSASSTRDEADIKPDASSRKECNSLSDVIRECRPFLTTFPGRASKPKDAKDSPGYLLGSSDDGRLVCNAKWGLVGAIFDAYNRHTHLVIRPDDVWQQILTQFSLYVNAEGRAERLRSKLVNHDGKKTLAVAVGGPTIFEVDYGGDFAVRMVDEEIRRNVVDPEKLLDKFMLPDFSTTTKKDRICAAVSVMSGLQSFFEYGCALFCGIPKVTLLGTAEDWSRLCTKAEFLLDYELEEKGVKLMQRWLDTLRPVLSELAMQVQDGKRSDEQKKEFWDRVCSYHPGGSGPSYLSGWVTALCPFSVAGKWMGDGKMDIGVGKIDTGNIASGVCAVPVLIKEFGTPWNGTMLVGCFGYEQEKEGEEKRITPRSDWCMCYSGFTDEGIWDTRLGEQSERMSTCVRKRTRSAAQLF